MEKKQWIPLERECSAKVLVISVTGKEFPALGDMDAQIRHCTFAGPKTGLVMLSKVMPPSDHTFACNQPLDGVGHLSSGF